MREQSTWFLTSGELGPGLSRGVAQARDGGKAVLLLGCKDRESAVDDVDPLKFCNQSVVFFQT